MYFSDNELLTFHRQGTHRFHRCTTGIPFTLLAFSLSASPRTRLRKFSWKKKNVAGDQPVIMCVCRKALGKRLCGNLLNSVEPYHHFLQGRKITDRLHHLILLLLIYSWIITQTLRQLVTHTDSMLTQNLMDKPLLISFTNRCWPVTPLAVAYKEKLKNKRSPCISTISTHLHLGFYIWKYNLIPLTFEETCVVCTDKESGWKGHSFTPLIWKTNRNKGKGGFNAK